MASDVMTPSYYRRTERSVLSFSSTLEDLEMTRQVRSLDLADARRIIAAGERKALEKRLPSNLAVVGAGRGLVAHVRMGGPWLGSVGIAIHTPRTSPAFYASHD